MKLFFERVFYYWRQKKFGHVLSLCEKSISESGKDPLYMLWQGMAYGAMGQTSKGLSKVKEVNNKLAMGLPISVASLCIHKMAKDVDYSSVSNYEAEVEISKEKANSTAVIIAGQIYWLGGDPDAAKELVRPLATASPANKDAAALTGWIALLLSEPNSGRWFDIASPDSSKQPDPLVLYGKASYFVGISRWHEALDNITLLQENYAFPEAIIEHAKIFIQMGNWDSAISTLSESYKRTVSNCDYNFFVALHSLAITGDLEKARSSISDLVREAKTYESENPYFVLSLSLLKELSWFDEEINLTLLTFIESLPRETRQNEELMAFYGSLLIVAKRFEEAKNVLNNALTETNTSVLPLLVRAYIGMKDYDEAGSQQDMFEAMADPGLPSLTMRAIYNRAVDIPTDPVELVSSLEYHVKNFQTDGMEGEPRYQIDKYDDLYKGLDLEYVSLAIQELLHYCNTLDNQVMNPQNGPVCDIIDSVVNLVPGATPLTYYLAVLAFGEKQYSQAINAIQRFLGSNWSVNRSQCYMLMAQMQLELKQFEEAENSLEKAANYEFSISKTMKYLFILAQLQAAKGDYRDAIKTIEGCRTDNVEERIDLALFTAKITKKSGDIQGALKSVDASISKYSGSNDVDKLIIEKASILAAIGRPNEALPLLEFNRESKLYLQAKKTAAKIHLKYLHDRKAYVGCFQELVAINPSKANLLALGDAYMKTKQFDLAVDTFREAAANDPDSLVNFARSLLIVHRYQDALQQYQQAAMDSNDPKIILEECNVLIKLKRKDEAIEIITDYLDKNSQEKNDWELQYHSAIFHEILDDGMALEIYEKLNSPSRIDIPTSAQKNIREKHAALLRKQSLDSDDPIPMLERAVELDPENIQGQLELARTYLDYENSDKCYDVCQTLLKNHPNCEDAALILSEVSSTDTIDDLEEAFRKSPNYFRTLVRFIEKCSYAGTLDKVPPLFELCEQDCPGLSFCRGLYKVFKGDPQAAINEFKNCRKDPDWGPQSMHLIFHIYVNPNRRYVWCEDKPIAGRKELEAAEKILDRLNLPDQDREQMEAIILLSENTQESVEKALAIYGNSTELPATIGRCKCYIRLGKEREANRNLSMILGSQPTHGTTSIFVEAYLMMTWLSMKEQHYDEAEENVQKALELDKSSAKGWEMLASICEKNKRYGDAAAAYEQAFNLSGKMDMGLGYKLAQNYYKDKDPVNAIKISRFILSQKPNFQKIKESILIPACADLRQ